jgi:putative transposase
VIVTDEAIRQWCRTCGQPCAHQGRCRRPRSGDTWHLDEVFLTIHGERHDWGRAVEQDGPILDILIQLQRRRDQAVAKHFFQQLLQGFTHVPRVIVTKQLKREGAAQRGS